MATPQIGYLGRTGPTFIDDSTVPGKKIVLQGQTINGITGLFAKKPEYAAALGLVQSEYSLGPYSDNQRIGDIGPFKQPASGTAFDGFDTNVAAMVSASTIPGQGSTTTSTTSTSSSNSTDTSSSTDLTITQKAATVGEQIQTFLSNYWWVLLILGLLLLWNPIIAPALGMGKKKKRSYR
ncbi:hypothetical protein [Spirosoma linguale]|uniref:Uncharacterized protein n=1 Tax=Spirosoma linguale (strain ATCC 33905 / DSM 74 / LMG 10896 / Claus 1) TaxID=504472 RepID=D2QGY4_SPILD|nr:hypothetical protein Slin_0687 [Spirosoma linguale DSM 74]